MGTDRIVERLPADALAVLGPQLPALVEEIIDAIRTEVPAYARPLGGGFGEAVRHGVEEALGRFAAWTQDPGARRRGDGIYVDLGRAEFRQGRSLEALLAAY